MHVNQVRLRREEPIEKTDAEACYALQLAFCENATRTDRIESEHIQGDMNQVIQKAEAWIADRTEGYPKPAVHELLLNMLMHSVQNDTQYVEIMIDENQIAIHYPGIFPEGYDAVCEAAKTGITCTLQMNQQGMTAMLSGGSTISTHSEGVDLTDNEHRILSYLQTHDYVTNASAREVVAIGTTATRNLLNGLADKGYLKAEGANKGRKYYLNEQ